MRYEDENGRTEYTYLSIMHHYLARLDTYARVREGKNVPFDRWPQNQRERVFMERIAWLEARLDEMTVDATYTQAHSRAVMYALNHPQEKYVVLEQDNKMFIERYDADGVLKARYEVPPGSPPSALVPLPLILVPPPSLEEITASRPRPRSSSSQG